MTLAFSLRFRRTLGAPWVLLGCALVLHASTVRAEEDAETRTAARDLATQGAQAFDAGHFAEASDFFHRARELVHAPSIALLEARSLARLGRLLEAIDIYEQTTHFKLTAESPEAFSQAVRAAQQEIEDLRKRLPRLKLTLLGVSPGEVPQVVMDERPTPAALLGVERPVNPGPHQIVVRIAGRSRAQRELTLLEGESYQIALDVAGQDGAAPKVPLDPHPASVSTPPTDGSAIRTSPLRNWAYVSLGVGALGLGIGTYTGLVALHRKSDLDAACQPGCPASTADDLSSFRSNRTISWVSYGVGIAAAATGVVLLTLGKPAHEQLAVSAVPNGLQIRGAL